MLSIFAIIVRAILVVSGAVVLGLSSGLAKHQTYESVPPVTSYSAFVGAFGLIVTAIGLLSLWIEKIPTLLVLVADAFSAVFYIAAGIALTIALKPVTSCTATDDLTMLLRIGNKVLNGGCARDEDGNVVCAWADGTQDFTIGRCKRARVDSVFEYVGFIFAIGIIVITYLVRRRSGSTAYA